ncbi:M16 family metallopeptidase [Sphaerisporangium fuscum]|uniref:M16 family metallopeptidase n=1 Tax=Sphaerisporangium fuscum TaxID=2835868 RepID=UPI001BDD3BD6|nr:insulinase family protein [Sphaerisporangium fuscum]
MRRALVDRTLGNGLRLLALRHGGTPLAEARLHLPSPCPTRRDLAEAMLLAACLPEGHGRDDGVTEVTATADVHQTTVAAGSPLADLRALMPALAEMVRDVPTEPGPARGRLIARLRLTRTHPDVTVRSDLARHLFGDHPAAFHLPEEKELAAIGRVRRPPFDPRGALLVILADEDPGRMADAAEQALAGWRPPAAGASPLPPLPRIEGGRLVALPRPGAPQSRIRLRAPAVTAGHERYPALFLACNALGGYLSSRLSRSLREDKGYVYGVTTFFDTRPGSGLLAIEADTAAATTGAALEVLTAELHRMRTHPPTEQEIDAARAYALGSMATRLAPRAAFASALADLAAKAVDPLLLLDFPRRLAAVTREAVIAAADEFLAVERFSGVVAADPGALGGYGGGFELASAGFSS